MTNERLQFILALTIFVLSSSIFYYSPSGILINVAPMFSIVENPNYLANDWLINTFHQFNPRTYYIQTIIFVNKLFNDIKLTHLIIYLLISALIFINFFYLAELFFNDKKKSFYIGCLSLILSTYSLDKTFLVKNVLMAGSIAWLFCLLSLNFYFRKKYITAFFMAGLASLFHTVIGSISFAVIAGDVILSRPFDIKQKFFTLLKSIPFFIIYAFSIVPLFIIDSKTSSPEISRYASYILGWFMYPEHILPSTWGLSRYATFLLLMFFFYIAFKKSNCDKDYKKSIYNFAIVVTIICFIGYFFVEIIPFSSVVKMQLFRATILLNIFGYVFIGDYIYDRIKNASNLLEKIFFILIPLSFLSTVTVLIGIPLFLIGEILNYKFNLLKILWKEKIIFFILMLVLFTLAIKNMLFLLKFLSIGSLTTLGYLFLPPLTIYFSSLLYIEMKRLRKILIILALVSLFVLLLICPPLEKHYPFEKETIELFDFIKSKTPKDTIILSPPQILRFRLETERAIVVDYEGPYYDSELVQWYKRIQDVSNNHIKEPKKSDKHRLSEYYQTLDKVDVLRLQNRYHFEYVVFERPKDLLFNKIFENEKYVVYKIDEN